MLRSLFAGISGLNANQTMLDVTGNNIANANTVGFKSSTTVFEDTLSQMLTASAAPSANRGGTNPVSVGLGVQVAATTGNFTQGDTQSTGVGTDLMISGDGFFVLGDGANTGNDVYTRAGAFTFDSAGDLVAPDGQYVMGYVPTSYGPTTPTSFTFSYSDLNESGTTWTAGNGGIYNIQLPDGTTAEIDLSGGGGSTGAGGTLPTGTAATDPASMNDIYQELASEFGSTDGTITGANTNSNWTVSTNGSSITFTARNPGSLESEYPNASDGTFGGADGATDWTPSDWMAETQDANGNNATTPTVFNPVAVATGGYLDGTSSTATYSAQLTKLNLTGNTGAANFPTGAQLESYEIGSDGTITGNYDNGEKLAIGQIAIANFANPDGLDRVGDTEFAASSNSGRAQVGVASQVLPGVGENGSLTVGSLEMSNVDLASEFTNLILAQRGFEASSKVITTSDTVLGDLINMVQG